MKSKPTKTAKPIRPSRANYIKAREERGTQEAVATALGVARETLNRRESGARAITREAWLAINALPTLEVTQ